MLRVTLNTVCRRGFKSYDSARCFWRKNKEKRGEERRGEEKKEEGQGAGRGKRWVQGWKRWLGAEDRDEARKVYLDDILCRVALFPQALEEAVGLVQLPGMAVLHNLLGNLWVWLVAHLEHRALIDNVEPARSALQAIDSLPQIAVCREDDRLETICRVAHVLLLADFLEPRVHLGVGRLGEAQDSAARLNRLDDLGRVVARQRKPRGGRVQLHRPAHGLLGCRSHAVRLVEDYDLVLASRQSHLLLRKHLDLVSHDVDAPADFRQREISKVSLSGTHDSQPTRHAGIRAVNAPTNACSRTSRRKR
jgi:hypothetical protein